MHNNNRKTIAEHIFNGGTPWPAFAYFLRVKEAEAEMAIMMIVGIIIVYSTY